MSTGIATGIFGALGAALGGGVTLAANWISARAQRAQQRDARVQAVTDQRTALYVRFLTTADAVIETARDLIAKIDISEKGDPLSEATTLYTSAWSDFVETIASVLIAGPSDVASAASEFRARLGVHSDNVDTLHRSRRRPKEWDATIADMRAARKRFIEVAQVVTNAN